jgi:gas vesicle protein
MRSISVADQVGQSSKAEPPSNSQGAILAGFLLGTALGSLGALLLAPRSGRETRQQLNNALKDLAQITESLTVDVQSQAERLSDQALQQWEDTLNRLREAIAAGIEASQEESRNQQRRSTNRSTITVPAEATDAVLGDRSETDDALGFSTSDHRQGGSL